MNSDAMQVRDAAPSFRVDADQQDVPPGWKRTEVGVIPKEWGVALIGDFFEITSSKRVFQSDWKSHGVPFYRAREIADLAAEGLVDEVLFISEELFREFRTKYGVPKPDDVLVTGVGTLGRLYIVRPTDRFYFKDASVLWLKSLGTYSSQLLKQLFQTPLIAKQITDSSTGTTVGTYTIGGATRTRVPFPPLPEQRAIAEALSDVDGLLRALDALIVKKRAIKRAAMQQLLTGKTRLPGFGAPASGDDTSAIPTGWKVEPLGSISHMHGRIGWQGLTQTEFTSNPEDPFLITGVDFKDADIDWDSAYHVTRDRYDIAPHIQLRAGDVLMTKDGTIGKMLYVKSIPFPGLATLNSHLLVFRPIGDSYIPRFLYYQMTSRRFLDHIEANKSGSTFFSLSQEATGRFRVLLPHVQEQVAIAQVLSDLDEEITLIAARRDKTGAIKQGMMQKLLTGRVRLVQPEAAA